jgi:hypothetical protein
MKEEREIDIFEESVSLGKLLGQSGIRWAFIGGIALGIHGYIRATEDIDIIINPDDLTVLDQILKQQGYIINSEPINFKDGFTLYRRVKIVGEEYVVFDVMVPPKSSLHLLDNRIEGLIMDVPVYVISRDDLLEMKRRTGRKIDVADIEKLEELDSEKKSS